MQYPVDIRLNRRDFLYTASASSLTLMLPGTSAASVQPLDRPVKIGVIADLHHDIMHDGPARLDAFVNDMTASEVNAIIQLGDFAYPTPKNADLIDRFNNAHRHPLHVIGNHDTDAGFTKDDCLKAWKIPHRYYATDIQGIHLLVLDANDRGSPTHSGGYPSFIGEEQLRWLKEQLETLEGPIIVASHQPLAGAYAIDNATEIQDVLGNAASKIILAINGHSHIDEVIRIQNVTYMHINSASYKWVGGNHQHHSYSEQVHSEHPWVSYTCPYSDPLFARLDVNPNTQTIRVTGQRSSWVGPSPAELGLDMHPNLTNGEQIAPRIRDREFVRARI